MKSCFGTNGDVEIAFTVSIVEQHLKEKFATRRMI